jgi:hypothetical protein
MGRLVLAYGIAYLFQKGMLAIRSVCLTMAHHNIDRGVAQSKLAHVIAGRSQLFLVSITVQAGLRNDTTTDYGRVPAVNGHLPNTHWTHFSCAPRGLSSMIELELDAPVLGVFVRHQDF